MIEVKRKWITRRIIQCVMVACTLMVLVLCRPTYAAALSKTKLTITKGFTDRIKVNNANGKVRWSSSDKTVATVSSNGTIRGIGKGAAKIIARVQKKTYTCAVKVRNPISARKAEKKVSSYISSQGTQFYYLPAVKSKKSYIIWVTYTMVDMKTKWVVDIKSGKVYSYGPYLGVDVPATGKINKTYEFNVY